jgi:putative hydrolase of the HAD superfamily
VVTLDAGGTLVHPHPSVGEVYGEVLGDHGFWVDAAVLEERFRAIFSRQRVVARERVDDQIEKEFWRGIVQEALESVCPPEKLPEVFEDLFVAFASPERWRMEDDAIPAMRRLRSRGYELAILSNADSRFRHILTAKGFPELTSAIFISSEMGFEKPDVRIFRHVEEVFGHSPDQFVHIGDSPPHDAEGAISAGWHYFLVGENGFDGYLSIPRLSELPSLLPGVKV